MKNNYGFTLVEMLVVIGIIAVLISVMVPQVKKAQEKAKEQATVAQVAAIEATLENFAANHDGRYPGSAVDIMTPFPEYGLGDPNFAVGASPAIAPNNPGPGFSIGVIGGPVNRQTIKTVRNAGSLNGPSNIARYFDRLILDDFEGYPPNQFKKGAGAQVPMYNIFRYEAQNAGSLSTFTPFLYISNNRARQLPAMPGDAGRVRYVGIPNGGFPFDQFGPNVLTNDDKFFSPGDFAYVPIITQSPFSYADDPNTPGNDSYQWSTLVNGYMIFAYGTQDRKEDRYADERDTFGREGIPGLTGGFPTPPNAPAIDTPYEHAIYRLFNGAIYYDRK